MNDRNTTLGSVKARDILRDSRLFCKDNYGQLLKLSFPVFAAFIIYYLIVYIVMWITLRGSDAVLTAGLAILNIPLSLGGGFLVSMIMVSYIKRLNGKIRGEEITIQDSFKGSAITALKIFGISMLGVMFMYIPLLVFAPIGVITAVIVSAFGPGFSASIFLIIIVILAMLAFFLVFLGWTFYVGIHLMVLIQTVIIEPTITKWFKWCKILVKGKLKNISGVLLGIYSIILFISLIIWVPGNIIFPSNILFIFIASFIMLLFTVFLYPYIMVSMILLYYRLKSANWEKVSAFIQEEKNIEEKRVKVAKQRSKKLNIE